MSILQQCLVVMLVVCSANAVLELDDASFYSYAAKKQILLVDFYAPWCSDCTKLAPDYEAAAASLGPRSTDLAKVDCFGTGKGLCEMYGVKSWPQLKSFHFGSYNGDYSGPQTAAEIANYINTVENSASPQVASEQPAGNPYASNVHQSPLAAAAVAPKHIVATNVSCAKCKIEKPGGKIGKNCNSALKKACVEKKKPLSKAQVKYGADDK